MIIYNDPMIIIIIMIIFLVGNKKGWWSYYNSHICDIYWYHSRIAYMSFDNFTFHRAFSYSFSHILMEVETGRVWKVTAIGGTYFSLNHVYGRKGTQLCLLVRLQHSNLFTWKGWRMAASAESFWDHVTHLGPAKCHMQLGYAYQNFSKNIFKWLKEGFDMASWMLSKNPKKCVSRSSSDSRCWLLYTKIIVLF